jgi:uncharacterized protein YfkK (UPF0435 family)
LLKESGQISKIAAVMKGQGGVLTICTWLSVNFGIVTFTSAEKAGYGGIADVYPSISLKKAMSREVMTLFAEHAPI